MEDKLPENIKLPVNIKKMMKSIEEMEKTINNQKLQMANLDKDFQSFKKFANSFIGFSIKQLEKPPRKPSGFRLPTSLSPELCDFLQIEHGSKLPRTEVTKKLIQYISEKELFRPDKKTHIVPDDALKTLFGNDVDYNTLTRFTMQKYMNKHFI